MSLLVLDTDTLVLFQEGHDAVCRRVLSHPMEELAISVITVEEQLSGWYTLLRRAKSTELLARAYQRLVDAVEVLSRFRILSFTVSAINRFEQLKRQKLGVKYMDLRIAAITLEHSGTLVSQNSRDFEVVPSTCHRRLVRPVVAARTRRPMGFGGNLWLMRDSARLRSDHTLAHLPQQILDEERLGNDRRCAAGQGHGLVFEPRESNQCDSRRSWRLLHQPCERPSGCGKVSREIPNNNVNLVVRIFFAERRHRAFSGSQ
jgi:tRNA(fMet)-specific endonuclease VapC